jgi:hypothetical protein
MSKRQAEIKELRDFMDDYKRVLDRKDKNINTDAFPVLAFTLNKDKRSYSVSRQRGDFAVTEKIEIPEYYEGKPVTCIGGGSFLFSNVKEITIPKTVSHIEIDEDNDAFLLCGNLSIINVHPENAHYSSLNGILFNKIQTVLIKCPVNYDCSLYEIPNSVTDIWLRSFSDCKKLTEVTIPESVIKIGTGAFIRCNIRRVVIPKYVKIISYFTFYYCSNLADVTISDGVQSIENYSFAHCGCLTQITIPASVEKIGGKVFIASKNLAAAYGKGISKKPAGWSKDWNLIDCGRRVKAYWNH